MNHNKIQWLSLVRVLGLVLVLAYHLFQNVLPGGFFGVDVFFTLSGYLTTALLIEQFRRKGRFHLFAFLKRRFVRIFPPLFLAIAFTLPFALFISPDFTAGIVKQLGAAVSFTSNYFEILTGGSYEANILPHLYIHTWSLSVEMHFYLFWGLFCAIAALVVRCVFPPEYATARRRLFKTLILAGSVTLAVWSFLRMRSAYIAGADNSHAYFDTLSHGFPFMIGSAAAALWGMETGRVKSRLLRPKWVTPVLVSGFAACAGTIFALARHLDFNDAEVYGYGFLAASLLAAAAIYFARALHEKTPSNAREPKALTALADMSYDIYLFHWPLYILFSAVIPNNLLASVVTLVVSLVLSAVVYYRVEAVLHRPKMVKTKSDRERRKAERKRRRRASEAAVIIAAAVVLSVTVVWKAPVLTHIEMDIYTGQLMQDSDNIAHLRGWAGVVNDKPVLSGGELRAIGNMQENLYVPPAPKPPAAEPSAPAWSVTGGVTVIGDSVCLGARATLTNTIPDCYVDAAVSRFFAGGYDVMMMMQRQGTLREYVVVALGTNTDNNYAKRIAQFINDLAPGHRLIFVTPFDGRTGDSGGAGKTAVYERDLPDQYPFVTVADWNALIRNQTGLLAGDKVHMGGGASMRLYANCVADAINAASQKPKKG